MAKRMKRWISIGDYIINPDYFNLFYIEEVPVGKGSEWHIFGEDKNQICWRFLECIREEDAERVLELISKELLI